MVGNGDVPVTGTGKTRDLRWAMLAVIGETARHAGHADIIREPDRPLNHRPTVHQSGHSAQSLRRRIHGPHASDVTADTV
jgi:hypothetical protein